MSFVEVVTRVMGSLKCDVGLQDRFRGAAIRGRCEEVSLVRVHLGRRHVRECGRLQHGLGRAAVKSWLVVLTSVRTLWIRSRWLVIWAFERQWWKSVELSLIHI